MRKILLALLLCLLLTACGQTEPAPTPALPAEPEAEIPIPEEIPEPEVPTGGLYQLDEIPDISTAEEDLAWKEKGEYRQSVLWSPDGRYAAIARTTETAVMVTVLEPVKSAYWHMTLPNGEKLPEGAFLPEEDWGRWSDNETLLVQLGGVQDPDQIRTYRCSLRLEGGLLTGGCLEQSSRRLTAGCDLNHDGVPEEIELVTLADPLGGADSYELQIRSRDGARLWTASASLAHAGWTSIFTCEIDGKDYLLRYEPRMQQGRGEYRYQLFSLDSANPGQERLLRESTVVWDRNFKQPGHQLNISALADFLREVHGYLDGSTLLMSTENGTLRTGGSGAEFEDGFLEIWQQSREDPSMLETLLSAWVLTAAVRQK